MAMGPDFNIFYSYVACPHLLSRRLHDYCSLSVATHFSYVHYMHLYVRTMHIKVSLRYRKMMRKVGSEL